MINLKIYFKTLKKHLKHLNVSKMWCSYCSWKEMLGSQKVAHLFLSNGGQV